MPEIYRAVEVSEKDNAHAPGTALDPASVCVRALLARLPCREPTRAHQREACRYLIGRLLTSFPAGFHHTSQWSVERARSGAPRLDCDGKPSGLDVSLSHNGPWLAVAVGRNASVGVDVERARPFRDVAAMAEYMGWSRQVSSLDDFLERWTLWEACVKVEQSSIFSKQSTAFAALAKLSGANALQSAGRWAAVRMRESGSARFALALRQRGAKPLQLGNLI